MAGPLTLDRPLASMRENSDTEGLFEPAIRLNLQKVNSNISFFKRQKLLATQRNKPSSFIKNAKASNHFDYNKVRKKTNFSIWFASGMEMGFLI